MNRKDQKTFVVKDFWIELFVSRWYFIALNSFEALQSSSSSIVQRRELTESHSHAHDIAI